MARPRLGTRRRAPQPTPARRQHSPASARVASGQAAAPQVPTAKTEQVKAVWSMTRATDPKLPLVVFGPAVFVLAVLVVVGVLLGHPIYFSVLGVLFAVLAGMSIFGRRAQRQVYASAEGQIGAAAGLVQNMRGGYRVTPVVAFTRNQDMIHRAAGRSGVILIAEGPSLTAQRQLIADQKRRVGRVAPDVAVHEIFVGDGEGQVPLRKLQNKVTRLPATVRGKEVDDLEHRLKALGGTNAGLPKGPMPRNVRIPRG